MPTNREKLLKELKSLLKEVPDEGLEHLIRQTNILIYNTKVDELNTAARRLSKKSTTDERDVPDSTESVRVERSEGSRNMILVVNNERKIMDQEEMVALVRIAHTADTETAGKQQLYRWLKRERDDIVLDTGLSAKNEAMGALYSYLKTNFSLRDS